MNIRKKMLIVFATFLCASALTGCGGKNTGPTSGGQNTAGTTTGGQNTSETTTEEMIADAMYITPEDDKEFTLIRVKDDYIEITREENGTQWNLYVYTELTGMYPDIEDGQCAKVVADVNIYDGGEAGYMDNIFIKDLKSYTPIDYKEVIDEAKLEDASSHTFDGNNHILQYQKDGNIYLLILCGGDVEVYKDGSHYMEYEYKDLKDDEMTKPFFESLE